MHYSTKFLIAGVLSLVPWDCFVQAAETPTATGRYQVVSVPDKTGTYNFLVDTTTGEIWGRYLLQMTQDRGWSAVKAAVKPAKDEKPQVQQFQLTATLSKDQGGVQLVIIDSISGTTWSAHFEDGAKEKPEWAEVPLPKAK